MQRIRQVVEQGAYVAEIEAHVLHNTFVDGRANDEGLKHTRHHNLRPQTDYPSAQVVECEHTRNLHGGKRGAYLSDILGFVDGRVKFDGI
jgi:hypothetical protein